VTESSSVTSAAEHASRAVLLLGAHGVVFGDIGTSPISPRSQPRKTRISIAVSRRPVFCPKVFARYGDARRMDDVHLDATNSVCVTSSCSWLSGALWSPMRQCGGGARNSARVSPIACAAALTAKRKWHISEVFIRVRGVQHHLWRAIDQHGVVLDILFQGRATPFTVPSPQSDKLHVRPRCSADAAISCASRTVLAAWMRASVLRIASTSTWAAFRSPLLRLALGQRPCGREPTQNRRQVGSRFSQQRILQ
jgi:hypothetical protein